MSTLRTALAVAGLALAASAPQHSYAVPVDATNLADVELGALIVGPVGPEVEVSLVNDAGEAVGDLRSSVSCPAGFTACVPPTNPVGTIYTYRHTVTPGVDLPNDPPFPAPDVLIALDDVTAFELRFPATGFNGVAGFDFGEAEAALGADTTFSIDLAADGALSWMLPDGSGWDTGEAITFFWQTTQPPSGPGGIYAVSDGVTSGAGNGPVPTPISIIPEPASAWLVLLAGLGALRTARTTRMRTGN